MNNDQQSPPGAFEQIYRSQLAAAHNQPSLAEFDDDQQHSEAACQAAFELARTLGMCRWLSIEPGDELDGTLPCTMALAAASCMREFVTECTGDARNLENRWSGSVDQEEADNYCIDLIDARMDCEAVETALGEAYADAVETGDPFANELITAIDACQDMREQFDAALQENRDLLSTLTGTNYLDNWRRFIQRNSMDEPLPWWFSEELEHFGQQIDHEVEDFLQEIGTPPTVAPAVPPPTTARWLPAPTPTTLGATPSESFPDDAAVTDRRTTTYTWRSPSDTHPLYKAMIIVPEPLEDGEETKLFLVFLDVTQERTRDFSGQSVELANCKANVNSEGEAAFTYGQLRRAAAELRLFVGPGRMEWIPLSS